jgi:hypothetical protein
MNKLVALLILLSLFLTGCLITKYEYYYVEPIQNTGTVFNEMEVNVKFKGTKIHKKITKLKNKIVIQAPYIGSIGVEGTFKSIHPISIFIDKQKVSFDIENYHQRTLDDGKEFYLLKNVDLSKIRLTSKTIFVEFEFKIENLNGAFENKVFEEKFQINKVENIGNGFINKQMSI